MGAASARALTCGTAPGCGQGCVFPPEPCGSPRMPDTVLLSEESTMTQSSATRLPSFVKASEHPGAVGVRHAMRESAPVLSAAVAGGVTAAGLDAVMAGLASTDMLYFASGML